MARILIIGSSIGYTSDTGQDTSKSFVVEDEDTHINSTIITIQEQQTHRNCTFTEPLFAHTYHGDESNKASEGCQSTKDDHCNCLKAKGISGAIIIINGGFCKGYGAFSSDTFSRKSFNLCRCECRGSQRRQVFSSEGIQA